MSCKFDFDEEVTVVEQSEYHGMVGFVIDRHAGGIPLATGFGNTEWFYTVKLSNGQKHTFSEASIQRLK
ncbi:hypothetical protein [Alicyclobacillus mengziensis]|uniref:Uncharacterized protein n=1 Tax=Alicyclobacillus mengziensis TaxID=2931921 RepID=A0A9X7Z8L3_9BACL|nr:hypothetical protein [Alicyclobacillus mengziensis]QSO48545.1 hypothetical protein JZ786_06055 [Alicyclobacillus mengziensis]